MVHTFNISFSEGKYCLRGISFRSRLNFKEKYTVQTCKKLLICLREKSHIECVKREASSDGWQMIKMVSAYFLW